ncbi:MAG: hypothetical protein EOO96_10780 [Pedobacter sp.]|nr:MAG: hypothetical protein EOO96_10780 [Pedobacter sp.]
MKKLIFFSLFLAVISGCITNKDTVKLNRVSVTGTIEKIGMTTFQYGTHIIKTEDKSYALKSERINLDEFLNKKVTVKGEKVKGYPLSGGPEFLDVSLVKY